MKFEKLTRPPAILLALVILSVFVGLSCAAAADFDAGANLEKNNVLKFTVEYNVGAGQHWEISPESHGATFMTSKIIKEETPDITGSQTVATYSFLKQKKNCYVKMILIGPNGEIIKEVDSRRLY